MEISMEHVVANHVDLCGSEQPLPLSERCLVCHGCSLRQRALLRKAGLRKRRLLTDKKHEECGKIWKQYGNNINVKSGLIYTIILMNALPSPKICQYYFPLGPKIHSQ